MKRFPKCCFFGTSAVIQENSSKKNISGLCITASDNISCSTFPVLTLFYCVQVAYIIIYLIRTDNFLIKTSQRSREKEQELMTLPDISVEDCRNGKTRSDIAYLQENVSLLTSRK